MDITIFQYPILRIVFCNIFSNECTMYFIFAFSILSYGSYFVTWLYNGGYAVLIRFQYPILRIVFCNENGERYIKSGTLPFSILSYGSYFVTSCRRFASGRIETPFSILSYGSYFVTLKNLSGIYRYLSFSILSYGSYFVTCNHQ